MISGMEGTVRDLFLCKEKGGQLCPVSKLHLIAGVGIEGDAHANGGARQVSLLSVETVEWIKKQEQPGLCFKRYKPNITVAGLTLSQLKPGTRLMARTALLSVSEYAKRCFPECSLSAEGIPCVLSKGCLFLKIEVTGNIEKDDKIVIIA